MNLWDVPLAPIRARHRAETARLRLVAVYREEAQALRAAADELAAQADLYELRKTPMVGRGARLRAAEDELDEALAALE